jgi:hypothetical protein
VRVAEEGAPAALEPVGRMEIVLTAREQILVWVDVGAAALARVVKAPGVRVWLATGHTDMRQRFDGLALMVPQTLKRDPLADISSSFAVAAAISSNVYGTTARRCACSPKGSSEGGFCGRRRPTGR